jgi:DNA-binding transcriptional MerR regulator
LGGVSAKTLRFYDEIGLLRPSGMDPRTRYRLYSPQQLQDLAAILALKEFGVSLREIRQVVSKTGARKDRRELLRELRATVEHSISAAKRSLDWINLAIEELDDSPRLIPVVKKRRPPMQIACVRANIKYYPEIEKFESDLLRELPRESLGSLRGVLWHRCADSGSIDGEPFVELKRQVPRRSCYEVRWLPPVTVACAYSESDEDAAELAYRAIRKWINARGYVLDGPRRELYLDHMLEIQFPLASA